MKGPVPITYEPEFRRGGDRPQFTPGIHETYSGGGVRPQVALWVLGPTTGKRVRSDI